MPTGFLVVRLLICTAIIPMDINELFDTTNRSESPLPAADLAYVVGPFAPPATSQFLPRAVTRV
jgi:hypothetical protein